MADSVLLPRNDRPAHLVSGVDVLRTLWGRWAVSDASKRPFGPDGAFPIATTRPDGWEDYEAAAATVAAGRAVHCGIRLGPLSEDPEADSERVLTICGLDLDTCRDATRPDDDPDALEPWAREILDRLGSTYAEVSPSGAGVKAFFFVRSAPEQTAKAIGINGQGRKVAFGTGQHPAAVEMYLGARFFIVTGRALAPDAPLLLIDPNTLRDVIAAAEAHRRTAAPGRRKPPTAEPRDPLAPLDRDTAARAWRITEETFRATAEDAGAIFAAADPKPAAMFRLQGQDQSRSAYAAHIAARTAAAAQADPAVRGEALCRAYYRDCAHCAPAAEWLAEKLAEGDYREIVRTIGLAVAGVEEREAEAWPDPADIGDAEGFVPPALTREHVPDLIHDWAQDTAGRLGVDPAPVALAAIVTAAAAIPASYVIHPRQRDREWTEPAILWATLIGEPSAKKSPAMRAAIRPLRECDADAAKQHGREMRDYKVRHRWWADLMKQNPQEAAHEPEEPVQRHYIAEDATTEALAYCLRGGAEDREAHGKLLVASDEMIGLFGQMDRYRSGGGKGSADRGAYLKAYNGGPHKITRIGRGTSFCPSWALCILGNVQPEPLARIAKDGQEDGLLQRFIFAIITQNGRGEDRAATPGLVERYGSAMRLLTALPRPASPLRFERGAERFQEMLAEELTRRPAVNSADERVRSAFSKFEGTWARLALVFHLLDGVDSWPEPVPAVVPLHIAEMAARFLLDVAYPNTIRAYQVMGAVGASGSVRATADFIRKRAGQRITWRDLIRGPRLFRDPARRREAEDIIALLVAAGWLRPLDPSQHRSATTSAWVVNPKVKEANP